MPGADSGLEELVEDSEEPCAAQGEPGLRALGAEAGEEALGGRGSGKAQLRAGRATDWAWILAGGRGSEEGSFLTLLCGGSEQQRLVTDSSGDVVSCPLPQV